MDEIRYHEPRNIEVQAKHRHEVLWQITVPFIVGLLIIIAVAISITVLGTGGLQRQVADVSLIWLLMPAMIFTLVLLLLLAGLTFAVIKLIEVIPRFAFKIQNILLMIKVYATKASDAVVKPVKTINGWGASLRALFRKLGFRKG
ncbi:MAG: hypothetical protein ACM3PY_18120 [Omnitrophica WOR_2 bacterium]